MTFWRKKSVKPSQNPLDAALIRRAERDASEGRIESASDALRLAGELAAPSPAISPQLAGIRERLMRDEQGASESLRELLLQLHGSAAGQKVYDEAIEDRAHTAKLSKLNAELVETRAAYALLIEEGKQNLISLQENVDLAQLMWLDACGALERQRIFNQQLGEQLRKEVRAIVGAMKRPGAAPPELVKQWQVPSWHQPNQPHMDDKRGYVDVMPKAQ
jgi:hypothetical protein